MKRFLDADWLRGVLLHWSKAEAGHESEKSIWRENIDILNFHFLPTFCTFCFENCWEI
jgi:hypothetical protein